ncbi:MAG: acyl-CoA carboxylase subunit epsilon [Microbacteriaceae bacterium]|nr:acyl-CoA carboxylase subunit epsilon [Cryobacterium sp.]MBX3104080.1 acyl-CoA carboxylase subunit epsilon [Cryobacterium sp.]MCC6375415.1 acyl-CoA carboxylase subunit epsilon [Microbacteriaceae bacterium]
MNAEEPDRSIVAQIQVVAGNPTAEELAAVVAVIEGMSAELEGTRAKLAEKAASAWRLSQRPIRFPILPGLTIWRSFN